MLREAAGQSASSAGVLGHEAFGRLQAVFKRGCDVVLASVGLIASAPLFLLVALAIRIESDGPAFFRQPRVGLRGSTFSLFKFRTMHDRADEMKSNLRSSNGSDPVLFKLKDDPRLTVIGRFLRRTSLDELPQLVNVLRGDMSLVGPRPLPAGDYNFELDGMTDRLAVKPGLTGLWQINGRVQTIDEMVRLDSEYIARKSMRLDFLILLLTLPAVLTGRGAH